MNQRSELILAELGVKHLWRLRAPRVIEQEHDAQEAPQGGGAERSVSAETARQDSVAPVCPGCGCSLDAVPAQEMAPANWLVLVDDASLIMPSDAKADGAGRLLTAILDALGSASSVRTLAQEFCLSSVSDATEAGSPCAARLSAVMAAVQPRVVLAFGVACKAGMQLVPAASGVKVFELPSLRSLLAEPARKALVWEALCQAQASHTEALS